MKEGMGIIRKRLLIVLTIMLIAGALFFLPAFQSLFATQLLSQEEFSGIVPLEKDTTSVIIVHGIGHHCLGYGDPLVKNLIMELTRQKPESIEDFHQRYLDGILPQQTKFEATEGGSFKGGSENPLLDGSCRPVKINGNKAVDENVEVDVETLVGSQEDLCKLINESTDVNDVKTSCHKLYVNRREIHGKGENPEYVTGFIRRFSVNLTAQRRIRVYEVTWSPATRWIKGALIHLEKFNNTQSEHAVNRMLKSEIVNAAIADAVAYLSDSGILVNYNILQAFCLTFANNQILHEEFAFACDRTHLEEATDAFSSNNDVFIVTHSLGTRVLFDSVGMMSLGARTQRQDGRPDPRSLVATMQRKFERIGAEVPSTNVNSSGSESNFAALLAQRIPEFAKAVRSIYVFTNQVPLLAANLTSPFRDSNDAGVGFQEFLELRRSGRGVDDRLQVVAFHDPDDVLSYNLSCWYYQTVLKKLKGTKKIIETEAMDRAGVQAEDRSKDFDEALKLKIGRESRELRDTLFLKNCSDKNLEFKEQQLHDQIWRVEQNLLHLVDAAVRLNGFRLFGIAADPMGVHSNYFVDETVHSWLVKGNSGIGGTFHAQF